MTRGKVGLQDQDSAGLRIQRNLEFRGKLLGIKRAASEITPVHFESRHFAAALIHAQNQFLGIRVFIHVDLFKRNAALAKNCLVHRQSGHQRVL